jgi:hypothetical protein
MKLAGFQRRRGEHCADDYIGGQSYCQRPFGLEYVAGLYTLNVVGNEGPLRKKRYFKS